MSTALLAQSEPSSGPVALFETLLERWDVLFSAPPPPETTAATFIPERGVRGKYAWLRPSLSLSALEKATGQRAFLSGPHGSALNFRTMSDFGRYNPAFVNAVRDRLSTLLSTPASRTGAQLIYGRWLRSLARTYYVAHQHVQGMPDRQEITNRYLALVAAGTSCSEETNATARLECHPSRFLQRTFESFTGVQAGIGHDSYEASTAPGFWIRRYADSTEDEFLELLMLVLTSLDQPFLERTKGS